VLDILDSRAFDPLPTPSPSVSRKKFHSIMDLGNTIYIGEVARIGDIRLFAYDA
jgi:hypothetical protein